MNGERGPLLPDNEVLVQVSGPYDLAQTMAPYHYGGGDPTFLVDIQGIWRTFCSPDGPATGLFSTEGDELRVRSWGPGAGWVTDNGAQICGAGDNPAELVTDNPVVRELQRRFPGVRIAATPLIFDSLVPAILSQKVTGKEAFAWWRRLAYAAGEPAPGPTPRAMRVPPTVAALRGVEPWTWHRLGVGPMQQRALQVCAARGDSLQRLLSRTPAEVVTALLSLPGIGRWTAAEVVERVLGSPDHPSYGDYHIPSMVGIALTGEPFDDDAMEQALEPFAPHRGRVVRLVELAGIRGERHGPRRTVPDFRDI